MIVLSYFITLFPCRAAGLPEHALKVATKELKVCDNTLKVKISLTLLFLHS